MAANKKFKDVFYEKEDLPFLLCIFLLAGCVAEPTDNPATRGWNGVAGSARAV